MPVIEQLDSRAQHLLDAAKLFTKSNPELSSFLGSQLVEYATHDTQKPPPTILSRFCTACGMDQIPGLSATVSIETMRPKGRLGKWKSTRKTTGLGPSGISDDSKLRRRPALRSSLRTTCHSCRRYTIKLLNKPETPRVTSLSSMVPISDASKHTSMPATNAKAMSVAADTGGKKARRRHNKGGLAAMLALAKADENSKKLAPVLGFSDFASRR